MEWKEKVAAYLQNLLEFESEQKHWMNWHYTSASSLIKKIQIYHFNKNSGTQKKITLLLNKKQNYYLNT